MRNKQVVVCPIILLLLLLSACSLQKVEWPGYTGTAEEYTFFYLDGRDRQWEEDILFMAGKFLDGHPLLSNSDFFTMTLNDLHDNLSSEYSYEYTNEHFDEELRLEFIDQISMLIPRISKLNDFEIRYELSRIVALLEDAHSGVNKDAGALIPLLFEVVGEETAVQLATVRVPQKYSYLLGSKLIGINGTPIKEIVERLTAFCSHENEYYPVHKITNLYEITHMQMLTQKPALEIVGIINSEEDYAEFTFETDTGIMSETLFFVSPDAYFEMELIDHYMVSSSSLRFRLNNNFWYTIAESGDSTYLYMRIRKMYSDMYDINEFYTMVASELKNADKPLRLIIDFRDNSGGDLQVGTAKSFARMVNQCKTNGVFILINGGCFSAGSITPYIFANTIEEAQLVGSPTGQPGNIFGPSYSYRTPNFNMMFYMSDRFYCHTSENELNAIYPDITIYQTWEDYQNNVDTVLEYVLALK